MTYTIVNTAPGLRQGCLMGSQPSHRPLDNLISNGKQYIFKQMIKKKTAYILMPTPAP
jgi:hypothetical protein